jgi:hypothetical protein
LSVRPAVVPVMALLVMLLFAAPARASEWAHQARPSLADRVEELEQDLDSLGEDVDDLAEPVEEIDLFEECSYLIGVTERGRRGGRKGYLFERRGRATRRPALALDIRGFGAPAYRFLAFPAEEPPSIECNEDAGEEESDQD